MLLLFLGIVIVLPPLLSVPTILKNKKEKGYFFASDPRILVAKSGNYGNNLNMKNKYAFFMELVLGIALIVTAILRW